MPKPELTKKLIADTLKKLASGKHLDKISISEIVKNAELNRQTFYYHFRDKQELICWIFDTDVNVLAENADNKILLDHIIGYIYSERIFYIDALTSEVQNNLREYLYKYCYLRCMDELLVILDSREIDEKALNIFARFFTHAIVGGLVQWAQEGMQTDNIQFIEEYSPILKAQLISAVESYMNR